MQLNITQKFAGYLMFFSVIPLLVMGVVSFLTSTDIVRDESQRYTQQIVTAELNYLELLQGQIEGLMINLSGSDDVRESIDASNAGQTETYNVLATQAQIGYVLNSYTSIDGLVSIDIFTEGGAHFSVGDTLVTENTNPDVRQYIYDTTLANESSISWIGVEENVNTDSRFTQVMTASRMLYTFEREQQQPVPAALLIVNYSIDELYDHFSSVELGEDAYLVVIDNAGRYLYHPDRSRIGTVATALQGQFNSATGTTTLDIDGQSVQVSYAQSSESGWVVASLVPVSTFNTLTEPIRNTTVLVLLASFTVVALAAILFNRDVVRPISQITEQYAVIENGNKPDVSVALPVNRTDEIGALTAAFNRSLESQQEREKLIQDLQLATQLAQESSRLKSEFLATVSHELRTPLNSITGYTGIILDGIGGEIDDEAASLLVRVKAASGQLLGLINEILDLSKIEAGHLEIKPKPIDINQVVEVTIQQMQVMAESKSLELSVETDSTLPPKMMGDSERIAQILLNLLSNAIKFTNTGNVWVKVARDDDHVVLSVQDTGVGIPHDAQGYIFDEFRQVDSSSKRQYGGTGLGLTIVRRLVTAMNGTISVESEVGVGSTFSVRLPIIEVAEARLEKAV